MSCRVALRRSGRLTGADVSVAPIHARVATNENGYAMAALLVGLAIMAVFMSAAMPVWSTAAKRAREEELIFRGEQYAHAIALYQRKYANAFPPSIDVLVNERFLRKKYLDPVTGGDFQILSGATGQALPGPGGGSARGGSGTTQNSLSQLASQTSAIGTGRSGSTPFGAPGGIAGVSSKSTEKSLRQYNGRGAYNEWSFVAVQRTLQAGGGPEGADVPGGPGRGRGSDQNTGRGGSGGFGGASRGNRPTQSPFGGGDTFRPSGNQGR